MKIKGRLKDISTDWQTQQTHITFTATEKSDMESLENFKNDLLDITVQKHREKRSIGANALLWKCLGDIAAALMADKWDVYLQMLKRYGKYTYICVKPSVVAAVKSQWRESEVIGDIKINGSDAVQMLCYFGSSTYNTHEFSVLLDGVISEMEEIGLETPCSEDMRRAIERIEKQNEIHNAN